jgi:hypothetical protein
VFESLQKNFAKQFIFDYRRFRLGRLSPAGQVETCKSKSKAFPDKFPIVTMLRALVCLSVAASAAAFAPGAGYLPSSTRARSSGLCRICFCYALILSKAHASHHPSNFFVNFALLVSTNLHRIHGIP